MAEKSPMTLRGYRALQEELKFLKGPERQRLSKAIGTAREHGDLSENAEYHAAKEAQGMSEAKIRVLEEQLATADVVDISKLSGNKILFGATVTLLDLDADQEKKVTIVGHHESDVEKGLISFQSPLARGLIGKSVEDCVTVKLPKGPVEYEILSVEFVPLGD